MLGVGEEMSECLQALTRVPMTGMQTVLVNQQVGWVLSLYRRVVEGGGNLPWIFSVEDRESSSQQGQSCKPGFRDSDSVCFCDTHNLLGWIVLYRWWSCGGWAVNVSWAVGPSLNPKEMQVKALRRHTSGGQGGHHSCLQARQKSHQLESFSSYLAKLSQSCWEVTGGICFHFAAFPSPNPILRKTVTIITWLKGAQE